MQDIKQRELKMQEKRKQTPWRDFVKEICSWAPVILSKYNNVVSRFPETSRINKERTIADNFMNEQNTVHGFDHDVSKSFFENMSILYKSVPMPNILHI